MTQIQEHQLVPFHVQTLPCMDGPWLVLAPHPDDESIGMGGTLAKAARMGIATHLVVLTDGALGGAHSNLVQIRQQEVQAAARCLGIKTIHFVDEPDRGLHVHAPLLQRIAALIMELKPAAVFFPGVQEFHPDHRNAALLLWQALQALGPAAPQAIAYEITGQSPANCLVDISDVVAVKEQAIAAYPSQLSEKNYWELVQALNKLRTLTLPPQVAWAEAFYRFSKQELQLTLVEWARQRAAMMLL